MQKIIVLFLPFQALMALQGNNYRLRNIVAKSAVANINKHISDSDATKNALADKKKADANRQKLTDENNAY